MTSEPLSTTVQRARPSVCTVIVAYHNTADLEECLGRYDYDGPVVVVDNGGDEQVRALVEAHGHAYLAPGSNVGFAAAVNLGLGSAQAQGRDVLLLNPDARADAALVRRLQGALLAPGAHDVAAVAPALAEGGRPQRADWPAPSPWGAWLDALGLERFVRQRLHFLVGAVLLLRSEAVADVGLFDERFFLYAEECDWQVRAQRRGWRLQLCSDVVAEHAGAGSSSDPARREMLFHRGVETFLRKWYGTGGWQVARTAVVAGAAVRVAVRRRDDDRRRLRLYLQGPRAVAARQGL
ncbi:glycosyltransferase family 2 protein [Motilibacter aurantiacus]|uniref:glycosyltransferase family 2 protein n=1 Tax=Motilibacter aurantiacus TaxID=2714955 RepID=UPI00140D2AD6|nr:glycosyltransferase family 2 protein [Motilibacter aurantiacus]